MTPFESLILRVVGPLELTAHEIATAVDEEIPGGLTGREGSVHPALISLERAGAIVSGWEPRPGGRRRVYRLPTLDCLPAPPSAAEPIAQPADEPAAEPAPETAA